MEAAIDGNPNPFGRISRAFVQAAAGEIEARLSETGEWELRVRREDDETWRLACRGDIDCGVVTRDPVTLVAEETIVRGPLEIRPDSRRVLVGDNLVELSRKEFALLLALAPRPERVLHKQELLEAIWDHPGTFHTRTLDSHASRLRRKLAAAGADQMVINVWGVGYRLWDRADLRLASSGEAG